MDLKQTQKWLHHLGIPDYAYAINSLGSRLRPSPFFGLIEPDRTGEKTPHFD